MTETKTAISLMIEKGDKIEKGDLVTIENAKGFIKNSTYEVFEVSIQDESGEVSESIIIQDELGSKVQFKIDDPCVYKVQNGF